MELYWNILLINIHKEMVLLSKNLMCIIKKTIFYEQRN